MPYWLKSADHGVMPVYNLSDVERNKRFGWELLNEGDSPAREQSAAPVVMPALARKKPGPKPKVK